MSEFTPEQIAFARARLEEMGWAIGDDVLLFLMRGERLAFKYDATTDSPTFAGIPIRLCERLESEP